MPTFTTAFSVNRADLDFILKQIQISEATSIGYTTAPKTIVQAIQEAYGVSVGDAALLPYGLRTVDGTDNNLLPGQRYFGAADTPFPRLTTPVYRNEQDDTITFGAGSPRPVTFTNNNYGGSGTVVDADPRIISNLLVDQSVNNPAAWAAALSHLEAADAQAAQAAKDAKESAAAAALSAQAAEEAAAAVSTAADVALASALGALALAQTDAAAATAASNAADAALAAVQAGLSQAQANVTAATAASDAADAALVTAQAALVSAQGEATAATAASDVADAALAIASTARMQAQSEADAATALSDAAGAALTQAQAAATTAQVAEDAALDAVVTAQADVAAAELAVNDAQATALVANAAVGAAEAGAASAAQTAADAQSAEASAMAALDIAQALVGDAQLGAAAAQTAEAAAFDALALAQAGVAGAQQGAALAQADEAAALDALGTAAAAVLVAEQNAAAAESAELTALAAAATAQNSVSNALLGVTAAQVAESAALQALATAAANLGTALESAAIAQVAEAAALAVAADAQTNADAALLAANNAQSAENAAMASLANAQADTAAAQLAANDAQGVEQAATTARAAADEAGIATQLSLNIVNGGVSGDAQAAADAAASSAALAAVATEGALSAANAAGDAAAIAEATAAHAAALAADAAAQAARDALTADPTAGNAATLAAVQSAADASAAAAAATQAAEASATARSNAADATLAAAVDAEAQAVGAVDAATTASGLADGALAAAQTLLNQAQADALAAITARSAADGAVLTAQGAFDQADAVAVAATASRNAAEGDLTTAQAAQQQAAIDATAATAASNTADGALAAAQAALALAEGGALAATAASDAANAAVVTALGVQTQALAEAAAATAGREAADATLATAQGVLLQAGATAAAATAISNAADAAVLAAQAELSASIANAAAATSASEMAGLTLSTAQDALAQAQADATAATTASDNADAALLAAQGTAGAAQAATVAPLAALAAAQASFNTAQQAANAASGDEQAAATALTAAQAVHAAAQAAALEAQTTEEAALLALANPQARVDSAVQVAQAAEAAEVAALAVVATAQTAADVAQATADTRQADEAAAVTASAQADAAAANAAQAFDTALVDLGLVTPDGSLVIPNTSPDVGLTASFNSWMTFFGQFFDHGLDLVTKGGNGSVYIPLQPSDPLYVEGSPTNFMVLTRATPTLIDGVPQHTNTTTSFIDQNQTYTSHPSHQVFLREYVMGPDGKAMSTGKLLDGTEATGSVHGAPGNWTQVKAQALEMLGIRLSDADVLNVPLLLTDQYGKFIPGANGYAQMVMAPTTPGGFPTLVEGSAAGLSTAGAMRTNHAFLDDIAHHAAPSATGMVDHDGNPGTPRVPQLADADVDADGDGVYDAMETYTDANANGQYDLGEAFEDLNADGKRDADVLTDVNGDTFVTSADFYADDHNGQTYDDELLGSHFVTGDGRGNENAALTAVHSIFHSEHNRLVEANKATILESGDMAFINEWLVNDLVAGDPMPTDIHDPSLIWDGERLFQAARFVTEMQYQHLVFEEFARRIQPSVDPFIFNNNPEINPAIVAEFAHTVYRFGHSMLTGTVDRLDNTLATVDGSADQTTLLAAFLSPQMYLASGQSIGEINANFVRGLSRDVGNEIDEFVVTDVRSNLLGLPLDLAALNIARGRETGVPSLNETRLQLYEKGAVELKPYENWVDFASSIKNPLSVVNFIAAYGTHASITTAGSYLEKRAAAEALIFGEDSQDRTDFLMGQGAYAARLGGLNDIDLWIGGLAEKITEFGGMLGQTFNWIFEYQMEQLQFGDRLYYLTRTQGMNLLNQLEPNTFTDLVMRNTELGNLYATHLSGSLFVTPDLFLEMDRGISQVDYNGTAPGRDPDWAADEPHSLLSRKVTRTFTGVTETVDGVAHDVGGSLVFLGGEHVVVGGTEGNDRILTDLGDDTLWGDGGNDYLNGLAGADNVFGGDGDDIIEDPFGDDILRGEAGNDVIVAARGLDLLFGGIGNDYLQLGQDASEVFAGEGDDFILGGAGSDFLLGNEGSDWMEGAGGFDGMAGDNSELFFNSVLIGHDVMFGHGDETDYDAESGDDIMGSGPSVFRYEGMLGFDWAIAKYDLTGVDFDMRIPFFTTDQQDVLRDRFDLVEALSGWKFDDVLVGDNRGTPVAPLDPTLEFDDHVLTAEGIDRIDGMRAWLEESGTGASALESLRGGGTTFRDGNMLLGGAGNDTFTGRGGFDVIDGDAWLNVRIAIHDRVTGVELYTAESLTTDTQFMGPHAGKVFAAGTDLSLPGPHTALFGGRSLQALLKDGTISPGQLKIVREIKEELPGATTDVDTAVYQGTFAEYEVEGLVQGTNGAYFVQDGNGDGFITVRDRDNGVAGVEVLQDGVLVQLDSRGIFTDDTDLLRGIERLQFTDQAITIAGTNRAATGTVTIVDPTPFPLVDGDLPPVMTVTPHVGQVLTAAVQALDADGIPLGAGGQPAGLTIQWQIALAGEPTAWIAVANGSTYTVQPGDVDNVIRAVAVFKDAAGVTERLYSAPTRKPEPTFNIDENSTAGALVAPLPFDLDADAHGVELPLDLATVHHEIDPAYTGGGRFALVQNGVNSLGHPIWEVRVAPGAPALDYEAVQSPVENQYRIVVNTFDVEGGTQVLQREFTILLNNLSEPNATGAAVIVDGNGGSLREGDTLTLDTASIADPDGVGTFTHRWQSSSDGVTWTNVPALIGSPLVLPNPAGTALSDVAGKQLRVVTSFVDATGQVERVTSAATGPVGAVWTAVAGVNGVFLGTAGDDSATGNTGADSLSGGLGNDNLVGRAGDDVLDGGAGVDVLDGGAGADLVIGGAGDDNLNGGEGSDVLEGGQGFDWLAGGAGADTMLGGLQNDLYFVDDAADVVIEAVGEGADRVSSSIDYALGANVENLTLTDGAVAGTGNELANTLTGNALNNILSGGAGNDGLNGGAGSDTLIGEAGLDVLDGGAGADTMIGGQQNDVYVVEEAADMVIEAAGEGTDRVNASLDYTLGAHVENLTLTGAAVAGTGNELGNTLVGNALNNLLSGQAGNDVLNGAEGNDTLMGGAGFDVLDGGTGADTMIGGLQNDLYHVDSASDVVVELAGEGADRVSTSIDYTLGANVENLTLTGNAAAGTGNELANTITGSALNNTLSGGVGNDVLTGGVGADTLSGGAGADEFVYTALLESLVGNSDVLVDFKLGADRINLSVIDAIASTAANEAFAFVGSGAFTAAGQVRYALIDGQTYVQVNVDGDSGADMQIAVVGAPAIVAADFIL